MRAVILSDSHGDTDSLDRAILSAGDIDLIVHLGDIARDVDYLECMYPDIRIESVIGNNDFLRSGDHERLIEFDGFRLFICHGHTLRIHHGIDNLVKAANEKNAQIALFGHTHTAFYHQEDNGLLVMNPGSTSRPRNCNQSFGVLETENSKISSAIVDWVL